MLYECLKTFFSLFFLVVTITMDMTIFSISKNDNEHLFVVAGFFVWIHVSLYFEEPTHVNYKAPEVALY